MTWDQCVGFKGATPNAQSCWAAHEAGFRIGQELGDVAIYGTFPALMQTVETTILQARKEMSRITVIDRQTGARQVFAGHPSDILAYPVKMRVFFALSQAELPKSDLFCGSEEVALSGSCALDLTINKVAQIRYYDYAGALVKTEPAAAIQ
jgi:hypothetical protein